MTLTANFKIASNTCTILLSDIFSKMSDQECKEEREQRLLAVLYNISEVVNAGLNPEAIKIIVELLESGVNPRALVKIIKTLKKDAKIQKLNSKN